MLCDLGQIWPLISRLRPPARTRRGKERERKKIQQQLPSIYSLGERLHKNTSDCHRVTSSEDNCRQQRTSSPALIKVKSGMGRGKKRKTSKQGRCRCAAARWRGSGKREAGKREAGRAGTLANELSPRAQEWQHAGVRGSAAVMATTTLCVHVHEWMLMFARGRARDVVPPHPPLSPTPCFLLSPHASLPLFALLIDCRVCSRSFALGMGWQGSQRTGLAPPPTRQEESEGGGREWKERLKPAEERLTDTMPTKLLVESLWQLILKGSFPLYYTRPV